MQNLKPYDNLKVQEHKKLSKVLNNTEILLFADEIGKFNKKKRLQKRNIILTTESLYNVRDDNFLTKTLNLLIKMLQ